MEENVLHASCLPYGMMINTQKIWDPESSAKDERPGAGAHPNSPNFLYDVLGTL